jgi:hypothetical protein
MLESNPDSALDNLLDPAKNTGHSGAIPLAFETGIYDHIPR